MLLPSAQKIGFLVLGTISAFSSVLDAYDVSTRRNPQGPLGVTLDYSLAISWPEPQDPNINDVVRNWMFSTHLEFKNDVTEITDEQLWQIARDAVNEMATDRAGYQINAIREPNALAVLAWGKEIILASSQRGAPSFSYNYANSPVLESLRLCQMVWRDNGPGGTDREHRARSMCAEPMAVQLYYASTENPLQKQHARIGTWVRDQAGNWGQRDPCGDPTRVSTMSRFLPRQSRLRKRHNIGVWPRGIPSDSFIGPMGLQFVRSGSEPTGVESSPSTAAV